MERQLHVAEQRIIVYDVIRVIATLLVVISHCAYYSISTDYGGCDYSFLLGEGSAFIFLVVNLKRFLYKFHMQLELPIQHLFLLIHLELILYQRKKLLQK